jgi:hypothetical protein
VVTPRRLGELAGTPAVQTFAFDGLEGRMRFSARPVEGGGWRIALCVHNTTAVGATGLDRSAALRTSLLSTHPIVHLEGGTFASPLEREGALGTAVAECESVNTYPILATPEDDVLVGAAIVLPDHPQLAPESRGNLFDGTEIEEALVLHVMALSADEREQIAAGDPAIRELVARTVAAKCAAPPSARSSRSTEVITTWLRPMAATAAPTRAGSVGSSGPGRPVATLQKAQARVQVSPMIMTVAWRLPQHSPILGQAASSHTVVRRCARKVARVASKACAPGALTRIHDGLGSTGVSGSRAFSGWRGRTFTTPDLSSTVTITPTFRP